VARVAPLPHNSMPFAVSYRVLLKCVHVLACRAHAHAREWLHRTGGRGVKHAATAVMRLTSWSGLLVIPCAPSRGASAGAACWMT
jgi:hypothetical protein